MKKLFFVALVATMSVFVSSCSSSNENKNVYYSKEIIEIKHQPFSTDGKGTHYAERWEVKVKDQEAYKLICYQKFECMEVGNVVDIYDNIATPSVTLFPAGTVVEPNIP